MAKQENGANKFRYEMGEDIAPVNRYGGGGSSFGKANFTGGYLVQKMIEAQERQMQNQGK